MNVLLFYKRLFFVTGIMLSLVMTCGCRKKLEAPEAVDPIFADLVNEQKRVQQSLSEAVKNLEEKEKEVRETLPRTMDRARTLKEARAIAGTIDGLRQKVKYYELRVEKRKAVGRDLYSLAFQKDEPWPPPEEFSRYKIAKRLREAPRSWDSRVPKIGQRYSPKREPAEGESRKD